MAEDYVGTKGVDDEIRKFRRREPLVYIRCFAHDLPARSTLLLDLAQIARFQSSRQSPPQYPRHRNPSMLAPQSGQTRLRIAEIKLVSMFLTTVYEAIMSLPVTIFHHRMHNVKHGAAGVF